jgi:hypothetical protein
MLKDIINRNETPCDFPENNKIELTDGDLFHFILEKGYDNNVDIKGLRKSQNNEWKETLNSETFMNMLSYKQLNNQDLALITYEGIFVCTIVEDS